MADEQEEGQAIGDPFELADKAVGARKASWWESLDSEKRSAWTAICGASAVGVLGVPILSLLLQGGSAPSSKHLAASIWLLIITLPVGGVVALLTYLCTSPPKVQGGPQLLLVAAVAGALGVVAMNGLIEAAGGSLGDFYCYNDGAVNETACREFNTRGLASTPVGSPAQNARFLSNVFVLTVDARGWLMVACGAVAGWGAGLLIRRASDGT